MYLYNMRTGKPTKIKKMNLFELDQLIERVKNDKELFNFYTKKRKELVKEINRKITEGVKAL